MRMFILVCALLFVPMVAEAQYRSVIIVRRPVNPVAAQYYRYQLAQRQLFYHYQLQAQRQAYLRALRGW